MRALLTRLLGAEPAGQGTSRPHPRLRWQRDPPLLCAVGDVHGRLDLLRAMEARIEEIAVARGQPVVVVYLGDLIDRGPHSAQVIDHLLASPPQGFDRLSLLGNHEAAMLDFLAKPSAEAPWLSFGGLETLLSYGMSRRVLAAALGDRRALASLVRAHVPEEHVRFLSQLPMSIETPTAILVHAGLRPGITPAEQTDADMLWYRDDFRGDYSGFGRLVVHGHTIFDEPFVSPSRVGLDTGAYASGRLTAIVLEPGAEPQLLTVTTGA
jgi:serine/threonine protein phosphatase 1